MRFFLLDSQQELAFMALEKAEYLNYIGMIPFMQTTGRL